MKKIWHVTPVLVVIALSGCGNNVDLVKSGVMNFNQTTTLGEALDNWDSCKETSWESFKTSNGVNIVQFSCVQKASGYFAKIKTLPTQDISSGAYDVASVIDTIQFTINKNDTFQASSAKSLIVWLDGKNGSFSKTPMPLLKEAYLNALTYDPESLKGLHNVMLGGLLSARFDSK